METSKPVRDSTSVFGVVVQGFEFWYKEGSSERAEEKRGMEERRAEGEWKGGRGEGRGQGGRGERDRRRRRRRRK